jgi:hypothetical protein
MTPFETEVLDSVLWQLKGFKEGKVTERVTKRILRATLRRIKPKIVGKSLKVSTSEKTDIDHAVPLNIVVEVLLGETDLSIEGVKNLLATYLVSMELTAHEHRVILKELGLSKKMPRNWDGVNPYARYQVAGIQFDKI